MPSDDPFFDVCDECGRNIVKAGHDSDCPNADDTEGDDAE